MLEEWAYVRPYESETLRADAFIEFLDAYGHPRGHSALKSNPPISCVNDLLG